MALKNGSGFALSIGCFFSSSNAFLASSSYLTSVAVGCQERGGLLGG